jgi:hypothetical protein
MMRGSILSSSIFTGLISASLLCASAQQAVAQTDSAAARALFSEGRTLMEAERFDEACPKLEESLRLDHGMGTQFNLAHCWDKLGRTASAWALFLDVAAAARAGNQPQREAAARERAKALESKLSRLRIDVPGASPQTKIERDGQDVGKAAWGMAVPVDPGTHVIRVTAPGKAPWSDEIEVRGTPRTFSVTVPALSDAAAPASTPKFAPESVTQPPVEADVAAPRSRGSNGQTVAALVVGGVGLAAVATGTIFAIQSRSDNAEALKLCRTRNAAGTEDCIDDEEDRRHTDLVDAAERSRLIGFVGFGVGGAALITAVILFATTDTDSDAPRAAFEVTPLWAGGVRGAALSGSF